MSKLGKMIMFAFADDQYVRKIGIPYVFMLNPEEFSEKTEVNYNIEQGDGSTDANAKYKVTKPRSLELTVVIDCTGVVDPNRTNLFFEILCIKNVCLRYHGKIHRPNFVAIYWGSFLFKGVLEKLDIQYTYFSPNGFPLRAKVTLRFLSSKSVREMTKEQAKSSPDLTHTLNVGTNNLPQISQDVYDDPQLYIQLAKFNKLDKFRNLRSDSKIVAPPLILEETVHDL